MKIIEIPGPKFSRFLFSDTRFALVWLAIRFYVGYEWLVAGWEKLGNPVWTGASAGGAVKGLLLLGLFTGPVALLGAFMNLNYLFAGTVSINPIMLVLQLLLILAWRTAGWLGLDRYLLPAIGTPWQIGRLFGRRK